MKKRLSLVSAMLSLLAVSACGDSVSPLGPVSSIAISPRSVLLNFAGATATLEVVATDGNNSQGSAPGVEWESLDTAVVSVSGDGTVTGGVNGIGRVVARVGEFADTIDVTVFNISSGFFSITGRTIDCADGMAAEFECSGVELESFLSLPALGLAGGDIVNDMWGWTDPQSGREYALVGTTQGVAVVDVSDPINPAYVAQLPKTSGRTAVWRDLKVYQNHVFVVADGSGDHGMQVFDLTLLRNVSAPPETFSPVTTYGGFGSAHNIEINEASGYAYVVGASSGGETCGGGLHMIDVRTPSNPVFAGCFADVQTGRRGTGYTHDVQCVIYSGPDPAYQANEICFGSNETALSVANVTSKSNPIAVSNAAYPQVGYAHQGRVSEDQQYFYMDDELDELQGLVPRTRTLIWDISDLDDPVLAAEFLGTSTSSDHNLYISGNRMYQSNYVSGLRVLDITVPEAPVEIGFFDTDPTGNNLPGFDGTWSNYPFFESGIVVVSSVNQGLFVLRVK